MFSRSSTSALTTQLFHCWSGYYSNTDCQCCKQIRRYICPWHRIQTQFLPGIVMWYFSSRAFRLTTWMHALCPSPLSLSFPSPPMPLNPVRGLGSAVSSPARHGQSHSWNRILVHLAFKIWHLVVTVSRIFLVVNDQILWTLNSNGKLRPKLLQCRCLGNQWLLVYCTGNDVSWPSGSGVEVEFRFKNETGLLTVHISWYLWFKCLIAK